MKLRQPLKRYHKTDEGVKLVFCISGQKHVQCKRISFRRVFSVRVSFINPHVPTVMPAAALVRPLAMFVHVSTSTLCRTRLRMFTSACSHQGLMLYRIFHGDFRFSLPPRVSFHFISFHFILYIDFISITCGALVVLCSVPVYPSIQIT